MEQLANYTVNDDNLEIEMANPDCEEYLYETYHIWKNIHEFKKEQYCEIPKNKYFCGNTEAQEKLYSYPDNQYYYGKFIQKVQTTNLEIMIGGSSSVSAILQKGFNPNDIDIYIKNLDDEHIKQLDTIIRELFPDCLCLVIRKPITLTWIIIQNQKIIWKIQLCTMQIYEFIEVFACYHSDIVCIGFEIQKNSFICLFPRWERFMERYMTNEILYFINMLNVDTFDMLMYGTKKICGTWV